MISTETNKLTTSPMTQRPPRSPSPTQSLLKFIPVGHVDFTEVDKG